MADSYFFYDLETSGIRADSARIMQFAGQRTDSDLKPIGEPVNVLIRLASDVLPDPDAIFITGITPQQTIQEGLTEAEFLQFFYDEVVKPNTIFLGFNTVRFDDEFMRYLHYRNFYDPYEWHWTDGCSRWDLLDVVRMTRALRPDGIDWPLTKDGRPTNRLELLTKLNKLDHYHAHDALSDVYATIAVAKLIRDKQPQLFEYLMNCRNKRDVAQLVEQGQPFVYTSGRYPSSTLHTTAAIMLAKHTERDEALVYDLRYDPTPFVDMTPEQMVESWRYKKDRDPADIRLPVKTIKYNRCPALAPIGVLKDAQERLDLTLESITVNRNKLKAVQQEFAQKVSAAVKLMDDEREQYATKRQPTTENVDGMLYDGFFAANDKQAMRALRTAAPVELSSFTDRFKDARLQTLVPLYKARNYPQNLSTDERQIWEQHVAAQLFEGGASSRLSKYFARLQQLAAGKLTSEQEYILEELQLYGESIMPTDAA